MKVQLRSTVFGSLFIGGLLLIAWQEYYRKSDMLALVGVPGPRGNSQRGCAHTHLLRALWHPPRLIPCRGLTSFALKHTEDVAVDAVTRKVAWAQKTWLARDSTDWQRQWVSIQRNAVARGGRPFTCAYAPDVAPPGGRNYWRFPDFIFRVFAYPPAENHDSTWRLETRASQQMPTACIHPLDDDQSGGGCDGALLKIPLPGGWVACWKEPLLGG